MASYHQLIEEANVLAAGVNKPDWYCDIEHDARWNCCDNQWQFDELMDQSNWTVERPRIVVNARQNQAGNLKVTWRPLLTEYDVSSLEQLEFTPRFAKKVLYQTEPYGIQRPPGELYWVRRPVIGWNPSAEIMEGATKLYRALVDRYDELIATLRDSFEFGEVPALIATPSTRERSARLTFR